MAELVKRRVKGLHQQNDIEVSTLVDEYEPIEEGLDQLKFERQVTMVVIRLTKNPINKGHYGYQEPIPESEVVEYEERQPLEGGERRPRPEG